MITNNAYTSGEYSNISGINGGSDYEFTNAGQYVTVFQDGPNTTLLGAGPSPFTVTALTSGNLYVHWTADAACNVACSGSVSTFVQYLVPPPCDNSTNPSACGAFGSTTVDPGGAVTNITTNAYTSGEYSNISGINAANDYVFTNAGQYVTVYQDGPNTTYLGSGPSPLTVTAITAGNLYVHWTIDASCAVTCTGSVTTTVQRLLSCTPPTAAATIAPDCGNSQWFVNVDLTGLGDASDVDIVADVNAGGEVAQYSGVSGLMVYAMGPYAFGDNVNIRVIHNGNNTCDVDYGAFTFSALSCPTIVTCGTPLNDTHCYLNNDATTWKWASSLGSPITITFNAGTTESCCDDIIIRDGLDNSGTILYNNNNGGDLTGLSVTSPSGNIFMEVNSDGSWSCDDGVGGPYTDWDWEVTCPSCSAPDVASVDVVPACPGGFGVDVQIDGFGSGSSATINYSVNSVPQTPIVVSTTGTTNLTGFSNGDDVDITVAHESDSDCDLTYNNNTYTCPPANDLCADAIMISCNSVVTGNTSTATQTGAPTAGCDNTGDPYVYFATGRGVWYTVEGFDGQMTASLCGSSFDTQIWIGTDGCGAQNCVAGNDDAFALCASNGSRSIATWTGSSAETYYIYVTGWAANFGAFTLTMTCGDFNPACTENGLNLEFQNDANPGGVTWEILNEAGNVVVVSGTNVFPANSVGTQAICLPDGCYQLSVTDPAGDGITGYELREDGMNGRRIIDNTGNSIAGTSAIANGGTFCLPIGDVSLIYSNCDKLDWVNYQYLVCNADANVTANWLDGTQNNDGYNFWIFDPNGTYSYRRFHTHAVSDGFSPASATRAARMKINGWNNTALTPHIPAGVMLNVRVRGVYNWNFTPWGAACTMMIDPVAASCPQVWLQDDPANPSDFSCGVTRNFGGPNSNAIRITAKPPQFQPAPLAGGTGVRYQFRFRIPGEGVCIVRPPQTSPTLNMNWSAASGPQLEASKTYEVEVRVRATASLRKATVPSPCTRTRTTASSCSSTSPSWLLS
jgi:hypothetical protein